SPHRDSYTNWSPKTALQSGGSPRVPSKVPSDSAQWIGAHSLSIRATNRAATSPAAKSHRSPPSRASSRVTSSAATAWKLPPPAIRVPSCGRTTDSASGLHGAEHADHIPADPDRHGHRATLDLLPEAKLPGRRVEPL